MKTKSTNNKENTQSKILLIRMWEILRRFGSDRPLSLEDIRHILIEDDRARGIEEDPQKDQYNLRLLRSNIKAINAALEQLPMEIHIPDSPERAELLARKQRKEARNGKELSEPIGKIIIGRGESKECLYYNSNAFTLDEVHFLHDAVNAQDCLTQESADKILKNFARLAGQIEPWEYRLAPLPAIRYEVSNVFDTIHQIEHAIKDGKRLSFKYLIGQNVDREYKWEPGMWRLQEIDPVAIFYRDGQYYLYGFNYPNVDDPPRSKLKNGYRALRIDRMTKVQVLDTPSEYTEDRARMLDTWKKYHGRIPDFVSWTGEPSTEVVLRTSHRLVPELFEKFGSNLRVQRIREKSGQVICKLNVNDMAGLLAWLATCAEKVEVVER